MRSAAFTENAPPVLPGLHRAPCQRSSRPRRSKLRSWRRRVEMQVGIVRGAEAVDEGHCPESGGGSRARTVRPQALRHRAQEQTQRRPLEVGVAVILNRYGESIFGRRQQVIRIRVDVRATLDQDWGDGGSNVSATRTRASTPPLPRLATPALSAGGRRPLSVRSHWRSKGSSRVTASKFFLTTLLAGV